jgi:hypothetical protein
METPDKNTIGESRGNSLSSGDPNLKNNDGLTSTDSTSSFNSGESAPQGGEAIVNEQEQHKTVNMEEYVENSAQNRFDDNEKAVNAGGGDDDDDEPDTVPDIGDDPDETSKKIPTMTSGVL